jgi:STAS domain-containing protein
MLRVHTQEIDGALICRLEGRFTRDGAEEVRRLVTRCDTNLELVVDLTEVMFIDSVGEEVLLFVKRLGAQFVAETSYSRDICERLHLRLVGAQNRNAQALSGSNGNGHRRA